MSRSAAWRIVDADRNAARGATARHAGLYLTPWPLSTRGTATETASTSLVSPPPEKVVPPVDILARCLLVVHIAAGTWSVAVGVVPLVTEKGGARHRRAGRAFVRGMQVVIGTALVLTVLRFTPYFAGLTASALLGVFSGTRTLRRRRPDVDPSQRATWLDWTVTLAVLGVAVSLVVLALTGGVARNLPVVRALGFGTASYALYDVYRFARPAAWPFTPRLWIYEHIVKLVGAYFAAVAAFSGSVLLFLDPPWRQLWAVALGQQLAILFVFQSWRRARAAGDRPSVAPSMPHGAATPL